MLSGGGELQGQMEQSLQQGIWVLFLVKSRSRNALGAGQTEICAGQCPLARLGRSSTLWQGAGHEAPEAAGGRGLRGEGPEADTPPNPNDPQLCASPGPSTPAIPPCRHGDLAQNRQLSRSQASRWHQDLNSGLSCKSRKAVAPREGALSIQTAQAPGPGGCGASPVGSLAPGSPRLGSQTCCV